MEIKNLYELWRSHATDDADLIDELRGIEADENEIYERLREYDITARKYFYPLTNAFECYEHYPTAGIEKTPIAANLADKVLTLPLYADLALEDVDKICDIILE